MKLIVTIVDDQDVEKIMSTLTEQRIGVTRVSSTGGLLTPGNSTLLIGLDDERVSQAMKIIQEQGAVHSAVVPYAHAGGIPLTSFIEVELGGYISFVLNVNHFEQV